jgi:low affinity Fe/Cu permease
VHKKLDELIVQLQGPRDEVAGIEKDLDDTVRLERE